MSTQVGQIRNNGGDDYLTSLSSTIDNVNTAGFNDTAIVLNDNFQTDVLYYVRLNIQRINVNEPLGSSGGGSDSDPHYQDINISLLNSNNIITQAITKSLIIAPYSSSNEDIVAELQRQEAFIKWCTPNGTNYVNILGSNTSTNRNGLTTIEWNNARDYFNLLQAEYNNKKSSSSNINNTIRNEYQVHEFVFMPYISAKKILLSLRRLSYDYNFSSNARKVHIDSSTYDVCRINNILPNGVIADKIGIQMDPGSLVIVNTEPMRVGKSGVLEINCGVPINFVGMAAPNREIKDFILDYVYQS